MRYIQERDKNCEAGSGKRPNPREEDDDDDDDIIIYTNQ